MKKALLPLLALAMAAAIGLLVVFTGSRTEDEAATSATANPAQGVQELPTSESPAPVQGEALAEGAAPERALAPSQAELERAARFAPGNVHVLRGSVRLPAGTPSDEELHVLAFEGESDPARLVQTPERDPITGDSKEPRSFRIDALDLAVLSEGESERGHSSRVTGLLAHVRAAPDGTFALDVPADAATVWLVPRGRYAYADRGTKVDPATDEEIVLAPLLGAWVTGRFALPANATPEESDLSRLELTLRGDALATVGMGAMTRGGPLVRGAEVAEVGGARSFQWLGVPPDTTYEVRAVPAPLAAAKSAKLKLGPGAHVHVDLVLTRGATVSGRVVDEGGAPVAKAKLDLEIDPVIFGRGGFEVREGESGDDGSFALRAVAPGKLALEVKADGFLDDRRDVEVAEGEARADLRIELKRGNSISGRVLWEDGSPAAKIEVEADFDPASLVGMGAFNAFQGAESDGKTDEEGRFAITGLGKGPFVVTAEAEPLTGDPSPTGTPSGSKKWKARAEGVKPGTEDLELCLQRPSSVAGRVVDESSAPVASFRIVARTAAENAMFGGLGGDSVDEKFANEDGSFLLAGLAPGKWELHALAEGFGRAEAALVELPRAADAPQVSIVLPRGASAAGVVLSPEGTPVAAAEVSLKFELAELSRIRIDGLARPKAKSGGDGTFLLEGLPSGAQALVAGAAGFASSEPAPVELAPAQRAEGLVLRLRRSAVIRGEVFRGDGELHAGASVLAQNTSDLGTQRFATSDDGGQFRFQDVAPGTWQVMTMFGGGGGSKAPSGEEGEALAQMLGDMKFTMVDVPEGGDVFVQLGAPSKSAVKLTGRVLLDGAGQSGIFVSFVPDGRKGMESMKFATTTLDGSYAVTLAEPGSYLVSLQKITGTAQQQTLEQRIDVPEKEEHELDFDVPLGRISGRVRGSEGPIAGARLSLWVEGAIASGSLSGGTTAEIATDEDGRYEVSWLRRGTYAVAAGGTALGGLFGGDDSAAWGREVRGGLELGEGQSLDGVDFHLRTPGRIAGVVRGSDGQPRADAAIFVRDATGRALDKFSFCVTDASGHFTYGGVAAGSYSVTAREGALATPVAVPAKVSEGEVSKVDLRLAPGTLLIVTLSGDDGNAVDCSVAVLDGAGAQVNGLWSYSELMEAFQKGNWSSKEQRVGPLPPGKYKVIATAVDGRSASKPVQLSGQAERRLNLLLKE